MQADHDARYHRQMLLPGVGEVGQMALHDAHVLIVGCGALGCVAADALTRAGVGTLSIVDRDLVELTNLQRQILYDENDAAHGVPKAFAAAQRLRKINSAIDIRGFADDFNAGNAASYAADADLIMDGLDNFETRYLLNDLAVKRGVPYVYGGAVATMGMGMVVLPRASCSGRVQWTPAQATPCLRCVFPEAPPPGASPTCETAGVLGPIVSVIAAWQAAQAIKLLTGHTEAVERRMLSIDLWSNELRHFDIAAAGPSDDCACCGRGEFAYLQGDSASTATSMCGRNAVQVLPQSVHAGHTIALDLSLIAARLSEYGDFVANDHLVRGRFLSERGEQGEVLELTLFANGRAILRGTNEPGRARSVYARYVGL